MTKDQVLAHFKGVNGTARALGISQPSVSNWRDPLPVLQQLRVESVTKGALKAGVECDPYRVPKRKTKATA